MFRASTARASGRLVRVAAARTPAPASWLAPQRAAAPCRKELGKLDERFKFAFQCSAGRIWRFAWRVIAARRLQICRDILVCSISAAGIVSSSAVLLRPRATRRDAARARAIGVRHPPHRGHQMSPLALQLVSREGVVSCARGYQFVAETSRSMPKAEKRGDRHQASSKPANDNVWRRSSNTNSSRGGRRSRANSARARGWHGALSGAVGARTLCRSVTAVSPSCPSSTSTSACACLYQRRNAGSSLAPSSMP